MGMKRQRLQMKGLMLQGMLLGLLGLYSRNLSFNQLKSFGSELEDLVNLQILDLQNNSLDGIVPDSLGELKNLHLLNLENNKLQGTLPQSLNCGSLDIRTYGNFCLSFSLSSCNEASVNPSIEAPQVTIFTNKKHNGHSHIAVILGAVGGVILALFIISLSVFLYRKRKDSEVTYLERTDMRDWKAAKSYSYKKIKAETNNFKEIIGRGSFGSVLVGKLPDGRQVAVKVRYDRTQLGADSFINEKHKKDVLKRRATVQEEGKGVNESPSLVYKDGNTSYVSVSYSDDKMMPEQPRNDGGIVNLSERNGTTLDAIEDDQYRRPEKSSSTSRGMVRTQCGTARKVSTTG